MLLVGATWTLVASSREEASSIEYRAPAECPAQGELEREVAARSEHFRAPDAGELARRYRVELAPDGPGWRARLELTDADGRQSTREVGGATCAEAARAIALVTALALDARARDVAEGRAAATSSASSTPRPMTPPAPSAPAASTPEPPTRVALPPPLTPPSRGPASRPWQLGWLLGAAGTSTIAPTFAAGPEIAVALGRERASLRLGFAYLDGGSHGVSGVTASFSAWRLAGEGCWRVVGTAGLGLAACGRGEAGRLAASGVSGVDEPRSETRAWGTTGARLRVGAASGRWVLDLGAGPDVPLARWTARFDTRDGRVTALEVPAVGFGGNLAVGVWLD